MMSARTLIAPCTHLLGIWYVTGIGQDKSAKLVKILYCPSPPVRRTEVLQHSHDIETLASSNLTHPDMA